MSLISSPRPRGALNSGRKPLHSRVYLVMSKRKFAPLGPLVRMGNSLSRRVKAISEHPADGFDCHAWEPCNHARGACMSHLCRVVPSGARASGRYFEG